MTRFAFIILTVFCTACSTSQKMAPAAHEVYALRGKFPHVGKPIDVSVGTTPVLLKFPAEISAFYTSNKGVKLGLLPGRTRARFDTIPASADKSEVTVGLIDGREYRLKLAKLAGPSPTPSLDVQSHMSPPKAQLNTRILTNRNGRVNSKLINQALLAIRSTASETGEFKDVTDEDRHLLLNSPRLRAQVVKQVSNGDITAREIIIYNQTDVEQSISRRSIPLSGILKITNMKETLPPKNSALGAGIHGKGHTIYVVSEEQHLP